MFVVLELDMYFAWSKKVKRFLNWSGAKLVVLKIRSPDVSGFAGGKNPHGMGFRRAAYSGRIITAVLWPIRPCPSPSGE